jgi:hypothetical protein
MFTPPAPGQAKIADRDEDLAHDVNPLALQPTIHRLGDLASERRGETHIIAPPVDQSACIARCVGDA